MSELSSKTPWRNGYWASPNMPAFVWVVDGEKMDAKNMIALDYPDIEGSMVCTIEHGDFGPLRNSGQPKTYFNFGFWTPILKEAVLVIEI